MAMKKTEFMKETEGMAMGMIGLPFLVFWSLVSLLPIWLLCRLLLYSSAFVVAFIDLAFPGTVESVISFFDNYSGLIEMVLSLLLFGSVVGFFHGIFAMIGKLFAIAVVTGPVLGARYFWAYTGIRPLVSYPLGFLSVLVFYQLIWAVLVVLVESGDVAYTVNWFTSCYVNLWNTIVYGLTNLWNAIVGGN